MSETETDARQEQFRAGILTAAIAIAGMIAHGVSIITVFRKKHLWNPFGFLCVSHAAGSLGALSVFALSVAPLLLIEPEQVSQFLKAPRLFYTFGQVVVFFNLGAIYTHVLLAINRFVAVCKPMFYSSWFSVRMTMRWMCVIWVASLLQCAVYEIDGCHYFFDRFALGFIFSSGECSQRWTSAGFINNTACMIFLLLTNVVTLIKLRSSMKVSESRVFVSPVQLKKRRSQEIRFFAQTLSSMVIVLVAFLSTWGISRLASSKWAFFILMTIAWEGMHALDGIILVIFNRNIHWLWCCERKKETNHISA